MEQHIHEVFCETDCRPVIFYTGLEVVPRAAYNLAKGGLEMEKEFSLVEEQSIFDVLDQVNAIAPQVDPHHHALVHNPFVWEDQE